ncbi:MAG TPA: serine/threonine-protein kinase, partial [Kofleriaceae bacterium]|nr:serine/threonine-protein kinase [Kofleriaceae bacterium]
MADDKDATLPAGESPSGLALDGTLPSGDDGAAPVVRAGRPGDYDDLIAVDPRHYLLGDEIARGGMGKIIKGRDRRFGREVAIKVLLGSSEQARARFEREARITGRLQHPAIISVHEAGVWPSGEPFFAMKLVAGRALDKVVADRATLAERLGLVPNVVAAIDALAYAHAQRVIHRDLKPSNVLVGDFGETVVIDWGLAKVVGEPDDEERTAEHDAGTSLRTRVGAVFGTPGFMAPDQLRG